MDFCFTLHAKERLKERSLTEKEVIEIINSPKKILKKHGKYYAIGDFGCG